MGQVPNWGAATKTPDSLSGDTRTTHIPVWTQVGRHVAALDISESTTYCGGGELHSTTNTY